MKTATKKNTAAIKSDLVSRGVVFCGNDPDGIAAEWSENFTASDAAAWMDVGFWDGSKADTMRTLGYTPESIKAISDAQTDSGIKYSSGDLIYALCNSDASPDDARALDAVAAE